MKTKKRLLSLALSGAMMLGLMPGMSMTALAADNVSTYTLQIPSTLNVSAAGWNETSGLTAAVSSGDTFDSGKKLSVTASSANNWSLKSGDNSVGYNLTTATGSYSNSATPASWEFTAAELNANGGTNKAMGIIVDDYSTKPAGTYQDTVTFTAKVAGPITAALKQNGATIELQGTFYSRYVAVVFKNNQGTMERISITNPTYTVEGGVGSTLTGDTFIIKESDGTVWLNLNLANDTYTAKDGTSSIKLNGTDITGQLTKKN